MSLRRVTTDSRLMAPTTRIAASRVREAKNPIAEVRLKRRVTGYSATAVPMPAIAQTKSSNPPQRTPVALPCPSTKSA